MFMIPTISSMKLIGGTKVTNPIAIVDATYRESSTETDVDNNLIAPGGGDTVDGNVGISNVINYQEYCRDIAAFLSQVSGWSYSDIATIQNKLSWITVRDETVLAGAHFYPIHVQNEALFVDATAQFIITHDDAIAIVSFRGTEITNPWNWFIDATTKKVPFFSDSRKHVHENNCKVHLGFKRNFEALWYGGEGILSKLLLYEPKIEAVYLTGHSLGGAMAVLAGLSLQEHQSSIWSKVRGIYTYGQPMVVDNADRDRLEERIGDRLFRHIYYNDVVPHFPPLSVGPYDHVGREFRFHPHGNNAKWHPRTPPLWNIGKDRATQVLTALPTLPFLGFDLIFDNIDLKIPFTNVALMKPKSPWSLADHNPGNYMEFW